MGKPTSAANARTSSPARARRPSGRTARPAARSASFIAGLSRHRNAVCTDVPGIVHASRTRAAAMTCASMVASRRSTRTSLLDAPHGVDQAAFVDDRRHLLVVGQPVADLVVEPVLRSLADADHRGADLMQRAHELALVVGEARFEEDHVHVGDPLSSPVVARRDRVDGRRAIRPRRNRSNLAGWAGYGYCASHSRYFWGLRLHLVCTQAGLPITFAMANPKVDERDVAIDMFETEPGLLAGRHGQTIIADKGYASAEFERRLAAHGVELIRRPAPTRPGDVAHPSYDASARSLNPSTTP